MALKKSDLYSCHWASCGELREQQTEAAVMGAPITANLKEPAHA